MANFEFDGSSAQETGSLLPSTFSNLIFNNSAGTSFTNTLTTTNGSVTINPLSKMFVPAGKKLTILGTLTNNGGSGGVVLKSAGDYSPPGSLIAYGSVSGSVTDERYISNNFSWHFLSSPVSDQAIWPVFSPTPTGDPLTFGTGTWSWDLYYWNPNANMTTELPWVNLRQDNNGVYNNWPVDNTGSNAGFGAATPVFSTGRGYLVSYNTGWNPSTGSPEVHSFTGTLNTGTINRTLTKGANAWNLAGNPYSSSIDWMASSGWTRTDLVTSGSGYDYWIFNGTSGTYGVFNSGTGSGTESTTRYIAPMQGFFVEAASSGSLGMNSAVQTHSSQSWLKQENEADNLLRLKLTTDANSWSNEMILAADPSYDNGGSRKFWSIYPEAPEICSGKNGKNYSIDRRPSISDSTLVNIRIKAGVTGTYFLTATGLETFFAARSVTLEDLKTGAFQKLNDNPVYTFTAGPDDEPGRLRLHFGRPYGTTEPGKTGPVSFYAFENAIYIRSNTASELKGEVLIYNMLGQLVKNEKVSGEQCRIKMNSPTGYYIVSLVIESRVYRIKILIQ